MSRETTSIRFLVLICLAGVCGGAAGVVGHFDILSFVGVSVGAGLRHELTTFSGILLVFFFLIPLIPATFSRFVNSDQAETPPRRPSRLYQASWWLYVSGAVVLLLAALAGPFDTGWQFEPTRAIESLAAIELGVAAIILVGLSILLLAISIVVATHRNRTLATAPGKTTIFAWGMLIWAITQLMAIPFLLMAMLLLLYERTTGAGLLGAWMGGDPMIFRHFFGFYANAALISSLLPAAGLVLKQMRPGKSDQPFGRRWIIGSMIGTALLSLLSWGQRISVGVPSEFSTFLFAAIGLLIAVPATLVAVHVLVAVIRSRPRVELRTFLSLLFFVMFSLAVFFDVVLSAPNLKTHPLVVYLQSGVSHYLYAGCVLVAFLFGIHVLWQKVFRAPRREKPAILSALLIGGGLCFSLPALLFSGDLAVIAPQMGMQGETATIMHISSLGTIAMALGITIVVAEMIVAGFLGRARRN